MKKYHGVMMFFVLLFILAGCSDKDTSSGDSATEEAPAENVQNQGNETDSVPKESTPEEKFPKPTNPNKDKPNGEIQTGEGKQPAPPASSGKDTESEHEDSAVPAILPSASSQEGPSKLEEQQIMMLMDEYMANYPLAVNEGAFIYIMHLIDPESIFYHDQADYVLETYNRNIKESLLYYDIGSITSVGEDTYQITVQESFAVYFGNEDREQVMDFENVYTVKKFQYGVFLITDLQVTSSI